MAVGKTGGGKVQPERNCGGCRWLVRGVGLACLEHLQTVPHDVHPICILICLLSRPTQEVDIFYYRKGPALMNQIKTRIPQKPLDCLLSLSGPQLEPGTKESFRCYTAGVRPSYPRYPCTGPFPNLFSHPTFCEAMKHGVLPPILSTTVGVQQSDFVQPHIHIQISSLYLAAPCNNNGTSIHACVA